MESVDVAIIGSGFGGLAMAHALIEAGIGPIVILEKGDRVGGTWRDNTYPGAACDVTSALYSFSFAPHVWTRKYPQQAEILAYIDGVVETFDLAPLLRFGAAVDTAVFDEASQRWHVTLGSGDSIDARVLISAVGQLNEPAYPQVPGLGSFAGPAFHSARWDHEVDLATKRVGIIGTGASVIQFGPRVAAAADTTVIFQRSAPYVLPKPDPITPSWKRRLYGALPAAQLPARFKNFALNEVFTAAILGNERLRARVKAQWKASMHSMITDPALRAVCTPDYELGCKRVLIADDWYPTLASPSVEVVTAPITSIDANGVTTDDGMHHDLDVLIFGTGFQATNFLPSMTVTGRKGMTLAERWRDGASAYRGVAVSGFPNLFMLYGPNTNLGSNSIVYMLESQAAYIAGLLTAAARADVGSIEVRPVVEASWAAMIEEKSRSTAWVTGCHSWYTSKGRNTNNWPDATWRYRQALKEIDLLDYAATPALMAGVS
jgi:cation diffusion facilitator CzcD-associated flavoprotein CzcO